MRNMASVKFTVQWKSPIVLLMLLVEWESRSSVTGMGKGEVYVIMPPRDGVGVSC